MKSSRFGFVILATVVAGAASFMGACSGDSNSTGGSKDGTGGDKNEGGEAGSSSSSGGKNSSGGKSGSGGSGGNATGGTAGSAGSSTTDECDGVVCTNDGNPCTEDVCNPATGTCGIPRTGTSCNDGKYCNGADQCDNGVCTTHAGSPCAAGQACNEDMDSCECDGPEDCPDTAFGEWSTPVYDTVCDETGARSRTVTTYACVSGMCNATVASENGVEARSTNGTACPDDSTFCNGTAHCQSGSCVPKGNPCTGGTFCNESVDACWVCENDQPNGTVDDGCTSGAPNCCNNACGTATCGGITNIVANTIVNPNIVVNQISPNVISNNVIANTIVNPNLVLN